MKDESKELLKDSYVKKEDFIKMIEDLNFTEIKKFHM